MTDNLRTLHAATTPGEWVFEPSGLPLIDDEPRYVIVAGNADVASDVLGNQDAAFIVAAHNELPALLARLDEVTAEKDALGAMIEKAPHDSGCDIDWGDVCDCWKSAAPSSVLAAHDAKVRAKALREAADDYRQQALPVNSELSMLGGAGPFVDKGIEGYMEAQHDAWDWLRARADEEENR